MKQNLDPLNPKKLYDFFKNTDHNIVVEFEWNDSKDTIIAGTFHILTSEWEHEITAANVCQNEPNEDLRLELHINYLSSTPKSKTKRLLISNLILNTGNTVRFCLVRYHTNEAYDKKHHCLAYSIGVPDVVKGGVVIKPFEKKITNYYFTSRIAYDWFYLCPKIKIE